MLECSADDLEWSDGQWSVKGSPERAKTIQELAGRRLGRRTRCPRAWSRTSRRRRSSTRRTSRSRSARTSPRSRSTPRPARSRSSATRAVDDCGNVINPMIVEGQVHGGIVQSIAQALFEETVYDESGQILTGSLVDYMIPTAAEMPRFDSGAHGDAVADEPARRQGHRRGGHDRGHGGRRQRRGGRALPSRHPAPRDAAAARACLGGDAEGKVGDDDPRGIRLRRAGTRRGGARACSQAAVCRWRAGTPDPGAQAAALGAGDARRHRAHPRALGHPRRGRDARDRRVARGTTTSRRQRRRGGARAGALGGRGRDRRPAWCATAARIGGSLAQAATRTATCRR